MGSLIKTDVLTGFRRLFYLVSPNETFAQHVTDVPNYFQESIVFFSVAILLEMIVGAIQQREHVTRLADGISSITAGMFMLLTGAFIKGFEVFVYSSVHAQFPSLHLPWDSALAWFICFFGVDCGYYWFHRMAHGFEVVVYTWIQHQFPSMNLPWNSPSAWYLCFLGVDFGYYWIHRMGHEVNFMWAAHQVHHSSEDYNLTTALRQSITQKLTSWMFYLPLAPFLPTSTMLVHIQFNTLYQFWIHTEVIDSLGPLEYILNTPSHHRVHHGRNRYCIDKNYAGTLIIFDRIFGTFEAEKKNDRVVYGLVHPLNSYNPLYIQYCHYQWMWQQFWAAEGIANKLSVIFKGPGWEPGKPRMGLIEDIPDIHYPQPRYDPQLPLWGSAYIVVHTLLNFLVFTLYAEGVGSLSQWSALVGMVYLLFSFTCTGLICDLKWYAPVVEILRCFGVLAALTVFDNQLLMFTGVNAAVFMGARAVYLLSMFMWLPQCFQLFSNGKTKEA